MTKRYKRIPAAILLILFVLYWAAVNLLVSAVLVPSTLSKGSLNKAMRNRCRKLR